MTIFLALVIRFLLVGVSRGQGPPCTGEEYVGEFSPDNAAATAGTNSGTSYIMMDTSMQAPCCGVVTDWKFATKNSGRLTAQVWRNTAGTDYQVVGENVYTGVAANTNPVQTVPAASQISVQQGDRIGWHSDGADIVGYVATGSAVMGRLFASGKTADQGVKSWAGAPVTGEQWHFSALLGPGASPSFAGSLPATATASTTAPAGTSIFQVAPTDTNADDIPDLTVSVISNTDLFEMNGLDVRTLGTLASGTYEVVLKVEDPCRNSATATLTVDVADEPPEITSLPISAYLLPEDTSVVTTLHDLVFTDDGDLTLVTCSMTSDPTPAPFLLAPKPGTSDYEITFVPSETYQLDYNVIPLYVFNVTCSDQTSTSEVREFQVSVQPNAAPVPNGPAIIDVDASTTLNGTLVHTVTSTNTDGDDLYYTMNCSCPFEMYPNGEIHATEDLCANKTTPWIVTYNVSDGYNTVGPETLTIRLTNINYAPNITTPSKVYPKVTEVHVSEHTDEGNPNLVDTVTSVYTVAGSDDDGDTFEWVLNFDNNRGKKLFNYDTTTGEITTAQNLDYEQLSRDGLLTTRVEVRA